MVFAGRHPARLSGLGDALNKSKQQLGRFALTGVALAALALGTADSWALGLGRLSVQSSLGETLRAEIDVTSLTPEEAANLKIRIAPPDSYRAAGVDYNSVLPSTQAALLRRPDGFPFLRLTSDRVVQEPFVDVILELSWSTGRLVREYTLLFDPPSDRATTSTQATTPAPLTAPAFSTSVPPQSAAPSAPTAPAVAQPREVPEAPKPAPSERAVKKVAEPKPAPVTATDSAGEAYRVRSGDTLTGIASRKRAASVSLDQMLVALYRGNPQAFVGDNINRLKSGVVLAVPGAASAAAVDAAEARRLIVAQSSDFGSFRQKLADAVPQVQADAATRKDTGKVQASVDDAKAAPALAPDKLTLSKAASVPASAAPEARISKDKEMQDAAARMAELSKNVEDLKKLSGATGASKESVAPVVVDAPPLPGVAASSQSPAASSPVAASEVSASSTASPDSVAWPKTIAPPKATAASQPASAAAEAEDQEPGFLSELLENNLTSLIAGGVALLALLGFGVYRARRPKVDSGETSFLESRLQPDSFFGASGGQRINTRESAGGAASSMNYSLSQLDAIGDVDPVAEADVYLAYGRDLQAEEILKEAMRSAPERMAIRTKLLEVYAKRRDTKGFELLATQLYTLTNGEGEDWATAQALGREIDPENPLYQPGGRPEPVLPGDSGLSPEPLGASTMPQSVLPTPSKFADSTSAPAPELMSLDEPEPSGEVDFHLDLDESESGFAEATSPLTSSASFDLDAPLSRADTSEGELTAPAPFDLSEFEPAEAVPSSAAPLEFDLSDISLDLDEPDSPAAEPAEESPEVLIDQEIEDVESDPLARKLELAEEFRLIGDVEGARDLLQEIATNAEGAMKTKALAMLENLG